MEKDLKLPLPNFGPGANEEQLAEELAFPTTSDLKSEVQDVPQQTKKEKTGRKWLGNPLKRNVPPIPSERQASNERNPNPFSQVTFWWLNRILQVGYKRTLEFEDIPVIPPSRRNEINTARLIVEFKKRRSNGSRYPLMMALHRVFWREWWFGGLSQFVATILLTLAPLMLKYLIEAASENYYGVSSSVGSGIGLAIGLSVMQIVASICINQFIYRSLIVGGMARASLISMIYAKSQVISARAKSGGSGATKALATHEEPNQNTEKTMKTSADVDGWSNGRVSNLMSTDTYRIDQAVSWVHILWTTPIQIAVALVQLIVNIGASGLAGFALLVIMVPFMTYVTRILARKRGQANKITDERISLTQELLQGVRFVKYFSWEDSFLKKIAELRKREIGFVQILLGVRSVITAIAMCLPVFAAIVAFLTYALTHPGFEPANVFSSLALFNGLRMPLNMLPMVIGMTIDAWVSLGRIESYLTAEEEEKKREVNPSLKSAINLENAGFTWETVGKPKDDSDKPNQMSAKSAKELQSKEKAHATKTNEDSSMLEEAVPFHMDSLNLSISRTELLAVVGPVGCGKTSLLAAIAGEMRMTTGNVEQGANMAYCPQYAWIQNATVQENITFGRAFDAQWYDQVVEACALKPDFKMFAAGDQTEVGERGITLSGGQKQRLSIARAIYFAVDIVILDDPLSAVDAGVGRHIFDEAICGVMSGKCRVLATHQLHVLSRCDRIVWMLDGKINAVGTYEELLRSNEGFAHMLALTASEEKVKNVSGEDEVDSNSEAAELDKLARVNTRNSQREPAEATLMQLEDKAKDSIKWKVYVDYMKASGSIWNAPLIILLICLAQSSNIVGTIWLSYWTSGKYAMSTGGYIGIYAALGVSQAVFLCAYSVLLTVVGTNASKILLQKAMQRILRAPMWFFDTTPLGRIINRFSKDVDVMDNFLTEAIRMYFLTLAQVVSIFILIIVYFPYFLIALVPMMGVLYFATAYYRASGREMKRHESVLRSTVFSVFGEALSGTAPIRAYGVQDLYQQKLTEHLDTMNSAYFLTFASQCWLSVRLDLIGNCLAFVTEMLVVTDRFNISPSLAGVVLSYVIQAIGLIQFTIRQLAEMENSMNSTERVAYYANELPSEIEPASSSLYKPSASWPSVGDINFVDVQMRYRPGLPLVLKGLSINVKGGERIGVVGRTGAGKSSIMSCLFRLVELSNGRIEIDGVDIATVGLHDLRSRISIIPQDPTLFRGTVRSNLDPMNEHSDLDLWNALRQAHLIGDDELHTHMINEKQQHEVNADDKPHEQSSAVNKVTLDTPVIEEGHNFSLGQRQLMALARALLRGSRIIVCDEATSSVDEETDRKIQQTMQMGFRGKTLLCIAHRLRTIINYDRVLVLDQGKIAECDAPFELWKKEDSVFRGICDKSRIRAEDFEGVSGM